ncbi:MAG: glycogen synthase GlgA, partial [Planctomycetes bacterium]|nr:glycogen synthase GlgA [Planctomycetota bacterium]
VPIVRSTGGLRDTVTDYNPTTLADGTATGFCFEDYSTPALATALERACKVFAQKPTWAKLQSNGMNQDWSWTASAERYAALYQQIVSRRRQPARSE